VIGDVGRTETLRGVIASIEPVNPPIGKADQWGPAVIRRHTRANDPEQMPLCELQSGFNYRGVESGLKKQPSAYTMSRAEKQR